MRLHRLCRLQNELELVRRSQHIASCDRRNGDKTWTTQATIVEAEPGRSFVFECRMFDFHFSTWGYRIEPTETGCPVTEWSLDLRPESVLEFSATTSGTADRAGRNRETMTSTLDRLAAAVEG